MRRDWHGGPTTADWDAAARLLAGAPDVLCIAHVGPDADALGSALAVALALRTRGARVSVSFGEEPFDLPRTLRGLPGLDLLVAPSAAPVSPSLAVSFDVASADRLGVLEDRILTAGSFLAVDHHASYSGFAGHHVVDPAAPATAVLVLELFDRLGWPVTPPVATALYAGLLTDTVSFRSPGTRPDTHRVAARLLEAGVRPDEVARVLYDDEPFPSLRLLGRALDSAVLDERAVDGLGVVRTVVTRDDRESLGLPLDAAEGIIEVLRTTGEAEVAWVLKEDDDGRWRASLRSRGRVDVGRACHALGGGGHRFAAGATLVGTASDVVATVMAALEAAPRPAAGS